MKKKKKNPLALYLIVFVTGAAVLVIEVAATRILSPYFGMTLFTVSSVLSVILAALSVGYRVGGKLVDRHPNTRTLYIPILLAGVLTLFIHMLNRVVLPTWSHSLDIMSGPLAASLVLFFMPSFFLGMVSPIAIRLSAKNLNSVGETAGNIFFFATTGSIVGSLATGFILIPRFSLSTIIIATGTTLTGMGLVGLVKIKSWKTWLMLAVPIAAMPYIALGIKPTPQENLLYEEDSMYQHIRVVRKEFEEGEGLLLMLDRTFSGAGFLYSNELPFVYTRYYKLYELLNPDAKRFLFLGGGSYTTPKKLLSERDDQIKVVVVEIDPKLPKLAREFFGLPDDPRQKLVINDARNYLVNTEDQFDMVFIDVFSMDIGIPAHLMTQEFFQLVKDRLSRNGVVIMNVAASVGNKAPSLGLSAIKTFKNVFPQSEFFALQPGKLSNVQNVMFFGTRDKTWSFDENESGLRQAEGVMKTLPQHRIDLSRFDFIEHQIFTDDYAPIEYLVAKMLSGS